jgi:3-oxoacyl-[acyl-carrier protein] reductase
VNTEGTSDFFKEGSEMAKQMIAQTPLGRVGEPDDIAAVAVFLASPDSRWITGETIRVAGGLV